MIDVIEAMSFSTDAEFTRLLSVQHRWTRYIATITGRLVRADIEDVLTSVISMLIRDIPRSLAPSIERARANSTDSESLRTNLCKVIGSATRYRVMDLRKKQPQVVQFSQIEQFEVPGRVDDRLELESLSHLVLLELHKMRQEARNVRTAAFLDHVIQIAPDRLDGLSLSELREKHCLKKVHCYNCIETIQDAVRRVAHRLGEDDPLSLALKCG